MLWHKLLRYATSYLVDGMKGNRENEIGDISCEARQIKASRSDVRQFCWFNVQPRERLFDDRESCYHFLMTTCDALLA
jgi:ferredoxin-thioredoxin reductase catalytic subunit